jgi:hypothetical protein
VWLGALLCYLEIVYIYRTSGPWLFLNCSENRAQKDDTVGAVKAWATRKRDKLSPAEEAALKERVVHMLVDVQQIFNKPGKLAPLPDSS